MIKVQIEFEAKDSDTACKHLSVIEYEVIRLISEMKPGEEMKRALYTYPSERKITVKKEKL
jgi:hypothetical protein